MNKTAWMHEDGEQFKIDDVYDLERRLSLAQGGGVTHQQESELPEHHFNLFPMMLIQR